MRQVRVTPNGLWHREILGNGDDHTACGISLVGVAIATRDADLDDKMCPICFTPHERDTGKMKKLVDEHSTEDGEMYFDDDEDPTDPNGGDS